MFIKEYWNYTKKIWQTGFWLFVVIALIMWLFVASTGLYFELTSNKNLPITVGELIINDKNIVQRGTAVYAKIPYKWDYPRKCSVHISFAVKGEHGEIYPGPQQVFFNSEMVEKLVKESPDFYEIYLEVPQIAKPGKAYLLGTGIYNCDDNKSILNKDIRLSYVGHFTIVE